MVLSNNFCFPVSKRWSEPFFLEVTYGKAYKYNLSKKKVPQKCAIVEDSGDTTSVYVGCVKLITHESFNMNFLFVTRKPNWLSKPSVNCPKE